MKTLNAKILEQPAVTRPVIVRRSATNALVYVALENGDNEGHKEAWEFIKECIDEGLVKRGELYVDVGDVIT